MRRIIAAALVVAALVPGVALAGPMTKYTFDGVTFSDGTVGVIEASSKTNKDGFTTCSYYSEGHVTYLGYFTQTGISFTDAASVEQFCLDHYAERETR